MLAGLAGKDARREQHPGVAGVGAARDRGDGDGTIARAARDDAVRNIGVRPRVTADIADQVVLGVRRPAHREGGPGCLQPVLRPPRAGKRKLDPAEVNLDHRGVARR